MKKSYLYIALMMLMGVFTLTSCNDEPDDSESKRLAAELPGNWAFSELQENEGETISSKNVNFYFDSSRFEVTVKRSTISRSYLFSVSGKWNIKSETLELYYDIDSLVTDGLTTEEQKSLYSSFTANNKMLDDLRNSKQAWGMPIEISRPNNYSGMMKLTNSDYYAGTYTLSGMIPSPERRD